MIPLRPRATFPPCSPSLPRPAQSMLPRRRNTAPKSGAPRSASRTSRPNDFGSVGYGVGYAFAQDNFCMMADEFVTVRGERSRYFGATGTTPYGVNNLFSDFFYTYFNGDPAPLAAGLAKHEARGAGRVPRLGGGLQPLPARTPARPTCRPPARARPGSGPSTRST